jgi:hypothetical protein
MPAGAGQDVVGAVDAAAPLKASARLADRVKVTEARTM